jgi:hypothetical protein
MGFIMNGLINEVGGILFHFRNEVDLRYGTNINNQGGKRKAEYSDADIESFKYDVANGARISDAAKEHGIPVSTARTFVPRVKKPKNRKLALSLLKQKALGDIDSSYRDIAKESGYTCSGILRIKNQEL